MKNPFVKKFLVLLSSDFLNEKLLKVLHIPCPWQGAAIHCRKPVSPCSDDACDPIRSFPVGGKLVVRSGRVAYLGPVQHQVAKLDGSGAHPAIVNPGDGSLVRKSLQVHVGSPLLEQIQSRSEPL
ncbi:unnamed protein product, partial [Musa textilis]